VLKRLYNYAQVIKGKRNTKPWTTLYPALQITNTCNKQCKGCLREANSYHYKMSYECFKSYLIDLQRLSESNLIKYQFVTGGEPTIWKDNEMDITDAIINLFKLNIIETVSMPTNGKVFEDLSFTRDFFKKISSQIEKPLIVGISISQYQENLSDNGYIALDNLITVSKEPNMKIIPVILVTIGVDDNTSDILKKIYPNVLQRVVPLAPLGDGEEFEDICPSLSLYGNDKESLGSFLPHFKNDVIQKLKISERDFDTFPNSSLIDLLSLYSHCGDSPFIDDRWHYCLPFKDDPEFTLCNVGEMREGTISDFIENYDVLKCIRAEGILSAVDEHKEELSSECRDKLSYLYSKETKLSVAYRGCMVCKKMYDLGIIKELTSANSSSKR